MHKDFYRKKRNFALCLICIMMLLFLFVLCAACATQPQSNDETKKTYDNDGLLGITNTNPNLRTSPTHYNYASDQRMIRRILEQFQQVEDYRIMINGSTIYVTLNTPAELSMKQWDFVKQEIYQSLSFGMPRYRFVVR